MDAVEFRRALLVRILGVTGSVGLGLGAMQACSRSPLLPWSITESGASGGGGGEGGAPGGTSSSTSGQGGFFVGTSSSESSTSSTGAGGACRIDVDGGTALTVCFPAQAGGCPSPGDAGSPISASLGICFGLVEICGGPVLQDGQCCYQVEAVPVPCYVGRTFFLDEGTLRAELRDGPHWRTELAPEVTGLSAKTRRALAEAWARDGLFEHASVASFARFAMQLLAVGAPADLVRDAHAGALDEVRHAELCLGLASAYEGRSVEPTPLPLPRSVALDADLASVAAETAMEGCIGETVAAAQAFEALLSATDPAVISVLEATVADETRHAELGWRFVAWALDHGGDATRAAVIRAFDGFRPAPPRTEDLAGVSLEDYAAHGRQPAVEARAIADRTLREVIAPAVCALLARRRSDSASSAGSRNADVETRRVMSHPR